MPYCECGRTFSTERGREQHVLCRTTSRNPRKHHCHIRCCRSFFNQQALYNHKISKQHWKNPEEREFVQEKKLCPCGKTCRGLIGLEDHQNGTGHPRIMPQTQNQNSSSVTNKKLVSNGLMQNSIKSSSNEARQNHLLAFYDNEVQVKSEDRKASVATVRDTLFEIMENVRNQPGGDFYSPNLRKAGSHAGKTKIGKADEFDWNIPMNIQADEMIVRTKGQLPYKLPDKDSQLLQNLNEDFRLIEDRHSKSKIPEGYAFVTIKSGANVPSSLLHNDCIVARYVKKDLYDKIQTALYQTGLNQKGVHLSREAHGPALTLTIMPPTADSHHISVDVVPSLPCGISVTSQGWKQNTFSSEIIEQVKTVGTHLVPKDVILFDISYSKAERALLEAIDSGKQCHKMCHQVIKKYVKTFGSQTHARGISTHIFKHQMFNMIEKHPQAGYWGKENFGDRMVDMLRVLRKGKLPNHFKKCENILDRKDSNLLNQLADHFQRQREYLENV